MSTIEVCLVRHAQSVSNAKNVWQGHGDSPLSDRGRTQAEALARELRDEAFDLVVSSDLNRAADTARALGGRVELDPNWREIDVGEWEGLTMEEVFDRFPEQIEALKERRTFAVGGGETWPGVFERVDEALATLRSRLPERGRAIVFTHGGIIAALLAGLLGARGRWPWPLGRMRNSGRTTLRFDGDTIELVTHNDDSHVPQTLRKMYTPRPDQVVVQLTAVQPDADADDTARLDFDSEIRSAPSIGAGGVVSVLGTGREIAELVQGAASPSSNDFRFMEPVVGRSTGLLISPTHRMLLDYALPKVQI